MTRSYRSSDKRLNPHLAAQVATVRGAIESTAEAVPLPKNFDARPHPEQPAMIIHDMLTGRETIVALCDYHGVRQALNDLFAE